METIAPAETRGATRSARGRARPRKSSIQDCPGMRDETTILLRSRLSTVALILFLAFGLFLLRDLIIRDDVKLGTLFGISVAFFGACSLFLRTRLCLVLWQLRIIEVLLFSVAVLFHLNLEHLNIRIALERGFEPNIVACVMFDCLVCYALVSCYCLFIPNTWRRAALLVVPMMAAPLLLTFFEQWGNPIVASTLNRGMMSSLVLLMCILTCSSIYGTHIINRLREKTFESEAWTKAIFKATPEGIIISEAGGTIASFNPAAEQIFGLGARDARGRNVRSLMPAPYWEQHHMRIKRALLAGEHRLLDTGSEVRGQRGDGTTFPMEIAVIELSIGGKRMFTGIVRDITERQKAEQALRDSERRFRAIFDHTFEFMGLLSPDGTVLEANKTALDFSGLTREKVRGQTLWDGPGFILSQRGREKVEEAIKAAAEGQFVRWEGSVMSPDGQKVTVDFSLKPVLDESGRVSHLILEGRDITQRKQAESELKRAKEAAEAANRAKSEFLANMSHEIRTPMNGILGMTQLALDTELTGRQRDFLNMVKRSADSLLTLLNDILDFSKIEAGKFELEQIGFALRESVDDTLATLKHDAVQKGLEFSCSIAPEVPDSLVGDPGRLRQVLVNLIGNAIKFTDSGRIGVRVALDEHQAGEDHAKVEGLHFEVADTGVGIPPEKQDVIFSAFQQADSSTTRRHGGTGLGLAICAELVQRMGGKIWVQSESGKGSTFHFTARFPIARDERSAMDDQCTQAAAAGPCEHRLRILMAEDNDINQIMAISFLEQWGHSVVVAHNGREALDLLERERFDVVLMDAQMPVMDGFKATAAIRARENGHSNRLPIIALTAHAIKGDRERCLAAGMDEYITKPINPAQLRLALNKLVSGKDRGQVFDRAALLQYVSGNWELLGKIVGRFRASATKMLADIQDAIDQNDASALEFKAHLLKGALGNFYAHAAWNTALRLEKLGDAGKTDGAGPILSELAEQVQRLQQELGSLMEELTDGEGEAAGTGAQSTVAV
jgi:PAS domain S-box-containing protein